MKKEHEMEVERQCEQAWLAMHWLEHEVDEHVSQALGCTESERRVRCGGGRVCREWIEGRERRERSRATVRCDSAFSMKTARSLGARALLAFEQERGED